MSAEEWSAAAAVASAVAAIVAMMIAILTYRNLTQWRDADHARLAAAFAPDVLAKLGSLRIRVGHFVTRFRDEHWKRPTGNGLARAIYEDQQLESWHIEWFALTNRAPAYDGPTAMLMMKVSMAFMDLKKTMFDHDSCKRTEQMDADEEDASSELKGLMDDLQERLLEVAHLDT